MSKNQRLFLIIAIATAIIIAGLFVWSRFSNPYRNLITDFNRAGIDCVSGFQKIVQHFHPRLQITVDGVEEIIPAGIGDYPGCTAEIHTHDASGEIHVESPNASKTFYLKNFFEVWGRSLERKGYAVSMIVDSLTASSDEAIRGLILKDRQQIILQYKTIPD
jgi:hypothetical protein